MAGTGLQRIPRRGFTPTPTPPPPPPPPPPPAAGSPRPQLLSLSTHREAAQKKARKKTKKKRKTPHRRAIKVKHVYKTEPPPLLPIADSRTHSVAWPDAALSATAFPFPIRAVGQFSGDSPPEWGQT